MYDTVLSRRKLIGPNATGADASVGAVGGWLQVSLVSVRQGVLIMILMVREGVMGLYQTPWALVSIEW